ncbi:oxidoreductase [Lithospermum erythrorhizon]|uniref:Oxidoreductase n=1 Tax=Lithospermum erythrorhizon TaxID=34254 RepID=A0AAV3RJ25_LITER
MGKVYTLAEASKHNTAKDCWLIIHGKVYDVTKFMDDHPGGDDVLLSATGMDATNAFEDIGHSSRARSMLSEYYIGDADTSTIPAKVFKHKLPKEPMYNPTSEFIRFFRFMVPLVILGGAIGVRVYTQ